MYKRQDKNFSRFKYFIPLRGFSDNIASDVYDYIDATEIKMGNPVKTAQGRISEADNPVSYTHLDVYKRQVLILRYWR